MLLAPPGFLLPAGSAVARAQKPPYPRWLSIPMTLCLDVQCCPTKSGTHDALSPSLFRYSWSCIGVRCREPRQRPSNARTRTNEFDAARDCSSPAPPPHNTMVAEFGGFPQNRSCLRSSQQRALRCPPSYCTQYASSRYFSCFWHMEKVRQERTTKRSCLGYSVSSSRRQKGYYARALFGAAAVTSWMIGLERRDNSNNKTKLDDNDEEHDNSANNRNLLAHQLAPLPPLRVLRPNPNLEICFDTRTRNAVYVQHRIEVHPRHNDDNDDDTRATTSSATTRTAASFPGRQVRGRALPFAQQPLPLDGLRPRSPGTRRGLLRYPTIGRHVQSVQHGTAKPRT